MTSLGIMTLSRSPYSELDKMSLFQDLKLKRRKVDSRCSSDGESLADTNASSPDLIVPLSPKMCDHGGSVSAQHLHNQQPHEKNRNSLSPAALDDDYNSSNATSNSLSTPSGTESPQLMSMDHVMRTIPTEQRTFNSVTVTTSKLNDSQMQCTANNNITRTTTTTTTTTSITSNHFNMNLSKSVKLINHTNNKNNVIINNHHGRDEMRGETTIHRNDGRRQSRESNQHNHNHNDSNNNSESLPNTSVIRLVGESAKLTVNSVNVSTAQQIMTPHATVLVTPLRIKTEANHVSVVSYHDNCVSGSTAPITTNAITSMSDYHRKGNMYQNAVPTVVTIETNNHSPNGGNYNSRNCNNNGNINSYATTNLGNKPTMQRTDAESKSNSLSPQKFQVFHTTTLSAASQQQQQQHQNSINSTGCGAMSMMKNSFLNQNQTQNNHNSDGNRQQEPSPIKNFMFPANLHAAITNPNPNRIKRERSPIHVINSSSQSLPMTMPQHSNSQSQPSQNPSITTVTPVTSSGQMLHPSIQLQHPARDGAILFRVKNDAQLPCLIQANNQNRIMWNSNTRINGVKPEIIGGPIPLRSSVSTLGQPVSTSNQSGQTPRNTPTVIMGESCGVRTMVWGIETPPSTQQQTSHQQTSQTNSISLQNHNQIQLAGPSNNEEAAQLLLSLGQSRPNEMRSIPTQPSMRSQNPLNMERLWAGDYSQLPSGQQIQALNLSSQQQWSSPSQPMKNEQELPAEDEEQPLVCMICEDKATGLHYGIITCEGCKGFFKRTVQNRRVYTCVADGTCEITKAQRNRCQYCRFKKCIEQGMVLQAVREDRMPGGRNSGAVYNLYKVKYKKHKKSAQKGGQAQQQSSQQQIHQIHHQHQQQQQRLQQQQQQQHQQQKLGLICSDTNSIITSQRMNNSKSENVINNIPSHLLNGTILKTALTNPSEIVHLRHRLDNAVSSSKDRSVSYEHAMSMIQTLIEFDAMEDIATLPHFPEFLEDKSEIGDKLLNIGDSIVLKLVSWTKKLPFYLEIPVEMHTKLLTDKWHEILVLTTAAYQALHGNKSSAPFIEIAQQQNQKNAPFLDKDDPEYLQEVNTHLMTLQTCLTTLMRHNISMEQLRLDVGHMVEKMTQITIMFRRIKLKMEEYVCLKVYILLNKEVELEGIQERYIQVMKSYLQHTAPNNPGRLGELLAHIPEIQAAASLLLESKMFYVPFVLNSASVR